MKSEVLCLLEVVWIRRQVFNSPGKKGGSEEAFRG